MPRMPVYKNRAAVRTCVKCNSTTVHRIEYHETAKDCRPFSMRQSSNNEHLHFRCATCSYDWIEETHDKKRVQEKVADTNVS
ncbi:MAG: hypothetical protein MN733_07280 [Nitrososphaera sp.]|nr:hypothetical protein [Nitrososphaera sp.]